MHKPNNERTLGEHEPREPEAILRRIERLEKENRRLKQGALCFLVAFASVGLMGQTQHKPARKPAPPATPAFVMPKDIEAESFVLKDPNGKTRAELSMSGTGPSLKLLDQSGSALISLSLNDSAPGGPFVLLSDPQHHAGISMSVLENAGSQISLNGANADAQAHLGVTSDGTSLDLTDADGFSARLGDGMQLAKNGQLKKATAASLALFNKDRKVLWSAP